jgi:hypothetical protein
MASDEALRGQQGERPIRTSPDPCELACLVVFPRRLKFVVGGVPIVELGHCLTNVVRRSYRGGTCRSFPPDPTPPTFLSIYETPGVRTVGLRHSIRMTAY